MGNSMQITNREGRIDSRCDSYFLTCFYNPITKEGGAACVNGWSFCVPLVGQLSHHGRKGASLTHSATLGNQTITGSQR
jgi:hypothetical protein